MTDAEELDWWRRSFSTRFHDGSLPRPGTSLMGRRFSLVDEIVPLGPRRTYVDELYPRLLKQMERIGQAQRFETGSLFDVIRARGL